MSLNSTAHSNSFYQSSAYYGYALYQSGQNSNYALSNQIIGCFSTSSGYSAWTQEKGISITKQNNGSLNQCQSSRACPCYHGTNGPYNQIIFDTYAGCIGQQVFGLVCFMSSTVQESSYICTANNSVNAEIIIWNGNFKLWSCIFADDVRVKNDFSTPLGTIEFSRCFFLHGLERLSKVVYSDCSFEVSDIDELNYQPWKCGWMRTNLFTVSNLYLGFIFIFVLLSQVLLLHSL